MKMKLWPKKKADYSKNSKTPGELSDTIDELTRIEMVILIVFNLNKSRLLKRI